VGDWKDWSSWIQEGWYISFLRDDSRIYEVVSLRDLAHWEYDWEGGTIESLHDSGPYAPADLEITKGYDPKTNTNHIWQMIFGIKGQAYIYIELPTDIHRHGLPKIAKPGTKTMRISHFEEWMSPFMEPSFLTEHFLIRPENTFINFSAYNPQSIAITDLKLNIFIAKLITERIGSETRGILAATSERWNETLDKLYRRVIPHRPLTLLPIRLPAEAPSGH